MRRFEALALGVGRAVACAGAVAQDKCAMAPESMRARCEETGAKLEQCAKLQAAKAAPR
jgi:hypothetical protein